MVFINVDYQAYGGKVNGKQFDKLIPVIED